MIFELTKTQLAFLKQLRQDKDKSLSDITFLFSQKFKLQITPENINALLGCRKFIH
ncbi:hypothetical protein [Methylomonas sp. AM2-LC]|uniref:hypothetical protein n=1 Tax=Methylomonas sp. AM2-LC TaxID=3153301 RepID=UPI00326559E4